LLVLCRPASASLSDWPRTMRMPGTMFSEAAGRAHAQRTHTHHKEDFLLASAFRRSYSAGSSHTCSRGETCRHFFHVPLVYHDFICGCPLAGFEGTLVVRQRWVCNLTSRCFSACLGASEEDAKIELALALATVAHGSANVGFRSRAIRRDLISAYGHRRSASSV
jgi:hypothetical protein